jgi:hypothetical protein
MSYGGQEIESELVSDDKSELWLTLQWVFRIKKIFRVIS